MRKSKKQKASELQSRFRKILDGLRNRATSGDRQASLDFIGKLTEYNLSLRHLGYRRTDDNDWPVKGGKLVRITKAWKEQNKKRWEARQEDMLKDMPESSRESFRKRMERYMKKAQRSNDSMLKKIAKELDSE